MYSGKIFWCKSYHRRSFITFVLKEMSGNYTIKKNDSFDDNGNGLDSEINNDEPPFLNILVNEILQKIIYSKLRKAPDFNKLTINLMNLIDENAH